MKYSRTNRRMFLQGAGSTMLSIPFLPSLFASSDAMAAAVVLSKYIHISSQGTNERAIAAPLYAQPGYWYYSRQVSPYGDNGQFNRVTDTIPQYPNAGPDSSAVLAAVPNQVMKNATNSYRAQLLTDILKYQTSSYYPKGAMSLVYGTEWAGLASKMNIFT